jgi:predicted Zn-dependent peptidase
MKEVLTGQSGRLFESLRNRRSLCYNTGVLSTAGFGQGMFVGYVLTAPETAEQARDAMLAELALIGREAAGDEEFERARNKLVGNLLISSQANSARVRRTLRDRIYGRDADDLIDLVEKIRACGRDEITAVAARLLDADNRYEVFFGPER